MIKNWYENTFSASEVDALNKNTLADVIRRNTGFDDIQDQAMKVPYSA